MYGHTKNSLKLPLHVPATDLPVISTTQLKTHPVFENEGKENPKMYAKSTQLKWKASIT